jgi:hypothetical protein
LTFASEARTTLPCTALVISDDKGLLRTTKVLVVKDSKILQEGITDGKGRLVLDDPEISDEVKVIVG